ncbi:hypothetical protein HOH87_00060 [bacterium]|jgi:hypothetical protein|nr:hypothetical protein [bacterium]
MRRIHTLIVLLLLLANTAFAANYFMLSDLGSSAEMIGKGNIEGFSDTSNSIFENPASLIKVKNYSTSFFTTTIMEEVQYNNVSMAYNVGSGVFGVGYMAAGVEDIPLTFVNQAGIFDTNESFIYKNHIIKMGYAQPMNKRLSVGGSISLYNNNIHTVTGTGFGLDLGLVYKIADIEVSLHGRNLAPQTVIYTDTADSDYLAEEELPLQAVFGVSYPMTEFDTMGQIKFDGVNSLVSLGGTWRPGFTKNLISFNLGYKEFSILNDVKNNITLGAGLDLFGIKLDYAFEKSEHAEYDSNNYFSISLNM